MPVESVTQAQQTAELLEKSISAADWAATYACDVVDLLSEGGNSLVHYFPLQEALALLGRAQMAKAAVDWAQESVDKAIGELLQQVHFSTEREPFARYDLDESKFEPLGGDDAS